MNISRIETLFPLNKTTQYPLTFGEITFSSFIVWGLGLKTNWEKNLQELIQNWTCDKDLAGLRGKNGLLLSECLINSLLEELFKNKNVEVYKMMPDWGIWHWGDHISEEYLFVTTEKIFILHLGESS
jgi:hypothetical protein